MDDDAPAARPPGVRKWVAAFAVCLLLAIGIPVGYSTWLVISYAQHACQALDLINASPPPHPTRTQLEFYAALRSWAEGDGC